MNARFATTHMDHMCKIAKLKFAVILLALLAPMLAFEPAGWAHAQSSAKNSPLITREEAEILIYVMPDAEAERKAGKDVAWTPEVNKQYDLANFYYFWVVGAGQRKEPGSITVGYFAVNKHTGDMWETVNTEHITGPQLSGVQKIIREHHNITAAVLKEFSGLRPRI